MRFLLIHKKSIKEMVRRAFKSHIQMVQKKRKIPSKAFPEKLSKTNSKPNLVDSTSHQQASPPATSPEKLSPKINRPHIPAQIQRQVHAASQHQCTYTDSITKRRCTKKHDLEIEHRIPIAKGGSKHLENLTLLCKAHNRLQAFRHFSKEKLANYYHP